MGLFQRPSRQDTGLQPSKMAERKVFIAIDGSKPAELAFNWYLENMNKPNDVVHLVHSAEYKVDIGLPGLAADVEAISKAMKEENDRITNMCGNYLDQLRQKGVKADQVLLTGSKAGEAVVKAATDGGASCIIMGSRGLGKVRRTLLGSVSEYVTHHAPPHCAIIIIRDS